MAEPYQLAGDHHLCTGSVGISIFHGTEVSVDEMFRNSDVAMYEAKRLGRNGLRFFDPAMQATIESRSRLESALRNALQENQFTLFFQKQVNANGEIIGAEALIRWMHPERGMVPPFEFIPVCEESGLIVPVGYWVLEEACRKLKAWQNHPEMKHLTISVNSSVKEFMQEGYQSGSTDH